MALNSNHTSEELGEQKCSAVEKNCSIERAGFLKSLLENNGFTVVIEKTQLKVTKPADETDAVDNSPAPPETFTIGVTDLSFNPVNAIYNRELKTLDDKIVTPTYWKQLDPISIETSWYWKK